MRAAVLQFHGVPDHEHPWVNTSAKKFVAYMDWLHTHGYQVIALRDLACYVDLEHPPADAIIKRRQATTAGE